MLWTGASIATIWSAGVIFVNDLPTTLRYADVTAFGPLTDADLLRMYFDPAYVSPAAWIIQTVVTVLFTGLLSLAVLRSRIHLLAEVKLEVVRSDLARMSHLTWQLPWPTKCPRASAIRRRVMSRCSLLILSGSRDWRRAFRPTAPSRCCKISGGGALGSC